MISIRNILRTDDPLMVITDPTFLLSTESAYIDLRDDIVGFGLAFEEGCGSDDCDCGIGTTVIALHLGGGHKAAIALPSPVVPMLTAMLNQAMSEKFPEQMWSALGDAAEMVQHKRPEGEV